ICWPNQRAEVGRVTEADGTLPGPVKVRSLEAEASPITRAEVSWVRPEKGGIETEGEVDTDTSWVPVGAVEGIRSAGIDTPTPVPCSDIGTSTGAVVFTL